MLNYSINLSEKLEINKLNTLDQIVINLGKEYREGLSRSISQALKIEAMEAIGIKRENSRVKTRIGYLNSGYERRLETSYGLLTIKKPRVVYFDKSKRFSSRLLPSYSRRTKEFIYNVLLLYFLGHSCRKSVSSVQRFFNNLLSAVGVSRIIKYIEEEASKFHSCSIEKPYRIIWIDGMEVKVRKIGKLKVLLALGEDYEGKRELIDYMISEREDELSYEKFLDNLRQRGLRRAEIFVHDGHLGLQNAIQTVFPYANQQICIFHKKMDAMNKSSCENRVEIGKDIDWIYSSNTKEEALNRLKEFNKKWKTKERPAVRSLNFRFMMTIKFLEFDKTIQKRIRTNNPIERYIEEIRRRIIPMRSFNGYKSLDRLLFGTISIINVNLREGIYSRCNSYFFNNF